MTTRSISLIPMNGEMMPVTSPTSRAHPAKLAEPLADPRLDDVVQLHDPEQAHAAGDRQRRAALARDAVRNGAQLVGTLDIADRRFRSSP